MKFILITLFILSTQAFASNLQNKIWKIQSTQCLNGNIPKPMSNNDSLNEIYLNFDDIGNLTYRAAIRTPGKPCLLFGNAKYIISSDYNAGIDFITVSENTLSGCGIDSFQIIDSTWEYEMVSANQLIVKKLNSKLCSGSILINTYTN